MATWMPALHVVHVREGGEAHLCWLLKAFTPPPPQRPTPQERSGTDSTGRGRILGRSPRAPAPSVLSTETLPVGEDVNLMQWTVIQDWLLHTQGEGVLRT